VWRWDGHAAAPIYSTSYSVGGDGEDQGAHVEGNAIRISAKGSYRMLRACGDCDGRQLVQQLKITPLDQVNDLGTTSLTPEVDLVDALLARVKANESAAELADPAVIAVIERYWNDAQSHGGDPLFINEPETVTNQGGRHELCFLTNYTDASGLMPPVRFTFVGSGAGLRAVNATESTDATTRSCLAAPRDEDR
jgi:hypothetical protein